VIIVHDGPHIYTCIMRVLVYFGTKLICVIYRVIKMIHPISNDYIFEVYKYRVISDTSTKRTTVEVLSLTL
jgi:hypothetical protein